MKGEHVCLHDKHDMCVIDPYYNWKWKHEEDSKKNLYRDGRAADARDQPKLWRGSEVMKVK